MSTLCSAAAPVSLLCLHADGSFAHSSSTAETPAETSQKHQRQQTQQYIPYIRVKKAEGEKKIRFFVDLFLAKF